MAPLGSLATTAALVYGLSMAPAAQAAGPPHGPLVLYTCNQYFPISYFGSAGPFQLAIDCTGPLGWQEPIGFNDSPPWAAGSCQSGNAIVGTDGIMRVAGYNCT